MGKFTVAFQTSGDILIIVTYFIHFNLLQSLNFEKKRLKRSTRLS